MVSTIVSSDVIRAMFARAISDMYKSESPQYRALIALVADVNAAELDANPGLEKRLRDTGELDRLGVEHHGAIRLGTVEELSTVRRLFAVMGMAPVGYYDLSVAGIPVHSTAFRPTTEEALQRNRFRVFTSLLRLELIDDAELRQVASDILARRKIVTPRCLALLDAFEDKGQLNDDEARTFVREAIETFRWHGEATVPEQTYRELHAAHPLIADVICFKRPHINHLALHTLDIDAAQLAMTVRDMSPKAIVEGPPRRDCDILLRQTSFKALQEPIVFREANGYPSCGVHAARFGEIEQRGVALTAKGRALFDRLLAATNDAVVVKSDGSNARAYAEQLERQFEAFPDDWATLHRDELSFFRYFPTAKGSRCAGDRALPHQIEKLVEAGYVQIEPIVYEDFLPVSAAGIFRSNLEDDGPGGFAQRANRKGFEEALGAAITDELALYSAAEANSRAATLKALGLGDGLGADDANADLK